MWVTAPVPRARRSPQARRSLGEGGYRRPFESLRVHDREPETTALYRIVENHLSAFFARLDSGGAGADWPGFVRDEFEALRGRGHPLGDPDDAVAADAPLPFDSPRLGACYGASVNRRVAFGPPSGHSTLRLSKGARRLGRQAGAPPNPFPHYRRRPRGSAATSTRPTDRIEPRGRSYSPGCSSSTS
jgi:hypothetical protein